VWVLYQWRDVGGLGRIFVIRVGGNRRERVLGSVVDSLVFSTFNRKVG
jgi:hypothetical protein